MSGKDTNNDGASGSSRADRQEAKFFEMMAYEERLIIRRMAKEERERQREKEVRRMRKREEMKRNQEEIEFGMFGNDVLNYEIYHKALSEGFEKDKSIRVNVVGNFAQGKTSLTNIIVGKESESVQSTNGIEINHCKYSTANADIKFCSQRSSSDDNEFHRRIASLVRKKEVENKSKQSTDDSKCNKLNENCSALLDPIKQTAVKNDSKKTFLKSSDYLEVLRLLRTNQCEQLNTDGDLQFWDFGGQFIFYATHSLFHSKTSVYIMVFDLTKPLSDVIEDPEFPNESIGKCIKQYAEYWMRSIHTYVGSDDGLQPPVILVGTHKDLLKGDESIRQQFADDYFDEIRKLFENTAIINHIQAKDYAVDCTNPYDSIIVELRQEIIRLGSTLHGIPIPARWLPLEKKLLARKHEKIIMYSEVVDIDAESEFPLRDEEQIKVFLLYQHAKGNLVYFDEEPLSTYVALDPQYVIDAFRCLITSERFIKKDPTYRPFWNTLRQEAKLEMQLLERVWSTDDQNNFLVHKNVLVMLLQRHHIISEALSYDDKTEETKGLGWYVVPSFLRSHSANDAVKAFLTGRQKTLVKFVMSFNITPVVQIVYYRVIAALVGKWEMVFIKMPEREKQILLYDNLGMFKLERHHVGIVELHQGFIDLHVLNLCNSGIDAAIVDLFRRFVELNVMNEFRKHRQAATKQRNLFEICFKCNDESHCFDGSQQTLSLQVLRGTTVEPCPDMMSGHTINTRKAYYEWFPDDLNIGLETAYTLKERDLSKLSTTVGENWEKLGIELGLHNVQLQHITLDYPRTGMRIFKMLLEWTDQTPGDATLNTLIQAMKSAKDVFVDWDEVRNIVEEIASKNNTRLARKTSTAHEI